MGAFERRGLRTIGYAHSPRRRRRQVAVEQRIDAPAAVQDAAGEPATSAWTQVRSSCRRTRMQVGGAHIAAAPIT